MSSIDGHTKAMSAGTNAKGSSSRLTTRPHFDILMVPGLRQFLLWKHGRTVLQLVTFTLAVIMILDGLLGTQMSARNSATVGSWVHYRGFVVVALLLVGNLFCAGC